MNREWRGNPKIFKAAQYYLGKSATERQFIRKESLSFGAEGFQHVGESPDIES